MRPTWVVIALVLGVGVVAYVKLRETSGEEGQAGPLPARAGAGADGVVPLQRTEGASVPQDAAADALEQRARTLLGEVKSAVEARDRGAYDRALATLKDEAWEAPSARGFAVKLGWSVLGEAERLQGLERMQRLDSARRLLSRGVYLDAMFDASGRPTAERGKLIEAIQAANQQVMTYASRRDGGLEGVTRAFEVPSGWAPVIIVSREKLPYGHNALLYWNHRGNLDPTRLRAGEILLLPTEALSVHVHLDRFRMGLYVGDWFVKEFEVGVGRADRPTPVGSFEIGQKMENPAWWGPKGHVAPLHPDNELGTAWMPIFNDELPVSAGFGLHGTNRPETVGTSCSNGCVRLVNDEASELYWWVRTGSAGGPATRVLIHGPQPR